jgi:predicted TPR repeat methyltransferase
MKIDETIEIYDQFSRSYDTDVRKKMQYTAYIAVPRLVIKHLNSRIAKILDLGCGTGLSAIPFFKAGYQVTGIDASRPMIEQAAKLPFQKLIRQNLEKPLRVKDQSFDAVVMIGVLEYLDHAAPVLDQVKRKLKQKGIFGLAVPQKSSWYTASGLTSYYKKEIEPLMGDAGFTIVECQRIVGVAEDGERAYYWLYVLQKA